jgi:geranyl-CoA carboxylase alpha subunit
VALGLPTNKALLAAVLRDDEFARGPTTDFLSRRFAGIEPAAPDAATLAIAATLLAAQAGFGEWNSWSSNPARVMRAKFGEREVALHHSEDAYRAEVGETRIVLHVLSADPPNARVAVDGAEEIVTFLIAGETVHLAHAGQSWSLANTTHAPPAARALGPSDGRVIAPMNGRVIAVNAKAGDTMEAGHALIVLEAMKMEHVLSVPAAARVKAVHVAAGAQVAPGQLLLELEAS